MLSALNCCFDDHHHGHGHHHNKNHLKCSDIIISKPVILPLTWGIMAVTIYMGRDAFLAHVFLVTFLLLIILYKINSLYGQFDNPHYYFYIVVLLGGAAHVAVPIVGIILSGMHVALYSHLCFCFIVHVLHLSQCSIVFQDITFKDDEFIIILWAVNIGEMIVNIVYVFDEYFAEEQYIACSLAVQSMALMIVNLNLHRNTALEESSNSSFSSAQLALGHKPTCWETFSHKAHEFMRFIDKHLVSRVALMMIASSCIVLMVIFGHQRYLIFMITLSIIMRLAVRKVDKICMITSINNLLDRALMLAPVAMIVFAAVTEFGFLAHGIGVSLTLVALIWGIGLMFFALYTITNGNCITVYIAFLMLMTSGASSIIYLLEGQSSDQLLLFACLTVSTSLLFFLSKIRTVSMIDIQKHTDNDGKDKKPTSGASMGHHVIATNRVHPSAGPSTGIVSHPSGVIKVKSIDEEILVDDDETKKSVSQRVVEMVPATGPSDGVFIPHEEFIHGTDNV